MLNVGFLGEISSNMELISFLRYVCALLAGERQHDRRESYKAFKKLVLFSIELAVPAFVFKTTFLPHSKNAPPLQITAIYFFPLFHFPF